MGERLNDVLLIGAVLLALTACSQTVGGQFCQVAKPIVPTSADVAGISDRLVNQILTHNETGAELCKWKP